LALATKIKYNLGGTVNLKNYENVKVDFGVEDDVRDGETFDEAKARIVQKVDETWRELIVAAARAFQDL
jgi:hypothetical protein